MDPAHPDRPSYILNLKHVSNWRVGLNPRDRRFPIAMDGCHVLGFGSYWTGCVKSEKCPTDTDGKP